MVWHNNYFVTADEYKAEYRERIRRWEKQWAYERRIVRSVPEKSIKAISVLLDNENREEPG